MAKNDDWIDIRRDEKHIRREREQARELKKSAWYRELLARGICHYCGRKFPPEELTLDHIVPVARGGRSVKGNVVVACFDCNQKKKYLTPAELIMRELEAPGSNSAARDDDGACASDSEVE